MADPTRGAALALLSAVLDRHRTLDAALDALPPSDARDRAAAHRLAAGTLRRLGSLDAVLDPYLRRAPPHAVRHILRLGAAGLLLLGTPAHAAVATAVALAREKAAAFAGLVNAVLRQVATHGAAALAELDGPRLDTPSWLWSAWGGEARGIAEAHQIEAPLDLSLLPGAAPPPGGIALPTGSWRYPAGTHPVALPGFADAWVQDAAAALPARLLGAGPGIAVADLCAAPGGKTAQLAAAGAAVLAIERDPARAELLRENLARLRLPASVAVADALAWRPPGPLDAVLLDAPCSATGTMRRHPDVAHLKRPRDLPPLAAQQDALLDAACGLLRPGGTLVYAVCSLLPEEGPARLESALARLPLHLAPVFDSELPGLTGALQPDGTVRTTPALWPELGGMDGFFIARMRRD